jgi:Na+/H+-translocating membrane pyrophosphatase
MQSTTPRPGRISTPSRRRPDRGSALLVVIILTSVLALIGLALVRRTTVEMESAGAKRNHDIAIECAEGARQMLFSQFRTFGSIPSLLRLDAAVGNKRYSSGHFDQFNTQSVVAIGSGATVSTGVNDVANRTGKSGLGGTIYRVTVVCSDSANPTRQSEVEYLVRFGL